MVIICYWHFLTVFDKINILKFCPTALAALSYPFFLAVTNVLACRHGRWQEYLPLTFAWMVSSCQLRRLKWSWKLNAQKLILKLWSVCILSHGQAHYSKVVLVWFILSSYFRLLFHLLGLCNIERWNEACERK